MLFNIFTYGDARGWSFDYYMGRAYELFINSTLQELVWDNVTYTAPEYTELPWGLGAWGAGSVRAYRMIDEPDRTAFIEGANESLNSGRYPKLKMSVYFDSTDQNTGETCAIGNATWRPGPPYSDTP